MKSYKEILLAFFTDQFPYSQVIVREADVVDSCWVSCDDGARHFTLRDGKWTVKEAGHDTVSFFTQVIEFQFNKFYQLIISAQPESAIKTSTESLKLNGLPTKLVWQAERFNALKEAIKHRLSSTQSAIPTVWVDEYNELKPLFKNLITNDHA